MADVSLRRALASLMLVLASIGSGAQAQVSDATGPKPQITAGMPAEFAALSQTQRIVADVYFGGVRIGQFAIDSTPATVQFLHPDQVTAVVADLTDRAAITRALSGPLDANARFVCRADEPCDRIKPEVAAVVYDAQHFRIDLFVNPTLLKVQKAENDSFLDPSDRSVALVDTIGGAIAGGGGQRLSYNLRNHMALGAGRGRLVSDASLSSYRGLNVDTLGGQIDLRDTRLAAGLFYSPGADLVGRRRIVGVGIQSQFDTRADRVQFLGSPIVVFLAQRSRVDLYVQGRLMTSRTYEAGNQTVETSGLPDGSYPVELRIQEQGGGTRTEQRFFTKSATLAPVGRIAFYANAGLLAVDRRDHWLALARTPLASLGMAGRFGTHFAWDGAMMATDRMALAEIGVSALTNIAQLRVAALRSTTGAWGYIAQIGSTGGGAFGFNLDLRRVGNPDQRPLIPLDDFVVDTFSLPDIEARQLTADGLRYTQLIGNVSFSLPRMQLGISGYYRSDAGRRPTYAVGPAIRWSILRRDRLQLTFDANYAETNRGRSISFGLQLQLLGRRSSFTASTGGQTNVGADARGLGGIAEISGSIQREDVLGGSFAGSAAVQYSRAGALLQAAAEERGPFGFAALSVVNRIGGSSKGAQFGLTAQTSVGIGNGVVRVGARDQNDAMISVAVAGTARGARFEVYVDEALRGEIGAGGHLTLAVTPYRRYVVRVRAIGPALVAMDTKPRTIDVYPGTFASTVWKADTVLAMFGRLVRPDGTPIANADVATDGAIAATDDNGYFQLQASGAAQLTVRSADGATCSAGLNAQSSGNGYTPLGDVICRR